jgi:hypothetical protein
MSGLEGEKFADEDESKKLELELAAQDVASFYLEDQERWDTCTIQVKEPLRQNLEMVLRIIRSIESSVLPEPHVDRATGTVIITRDPHHENDAAFDRFIHRVSLLINKQEASISLSALPSSADTTDTHTPETAARN